MQNDRWPSDPTAPSGPVGDFITFMSGVLTGALTVFVLWVLLGDF
jgi:hypothetical protein